MRVRAWVTSDHGAQVASALLALVAWQVVALAVDRVPGIGEVVSLLGDEASNGELFGALAFTLKWFLLGVAISVVAGVVLGIAIGLSPVVRAFLNDTMTVQLAVPGVIWALLAILWFGFSWRTPVFAVALTATPFVVINVAQGVQATPRDLLRMCTVYGVPLGRRIRHVVLPSVMDYVFAGIRFAIIMGWNAVLLAEWFGGREGVAWRARYWYDANRMPGFVAWIVVFIVFIVLVDRLVLEPISRRTFRWRPSAETRTEES